MQRWTESRRCRGAEETVGPGMVWGRERLCQLDIEFVEILCYLAVVTYIFRYFPLPSDNIWIFRNIRDDIRITAVENKDHGGRPKMTLLGKLCDNVSWFST